MSMRFSLLVALAALSGCLSHPPPPPPPYHAVGADGRWNLIIDDKHVTFIATGQQPIREPRPAAIVGIAGDIYRTERINVNIVHGSCTIGDRIYPDRVQVSVDGVQHDGCGGH